MHLRKSSSKVLHWARENVNRSHLIAIALTALLISWHLRNPLTRLLFSGKDFSGRSLPYQAILFTGYFLIFLGLAFALFVLYQKNRRFHTAIETVGDCIRQSLILRLGLLVVFLVIHFYSLWLPNMRLNDTARFGGDTWEYQSMAVNFAYGHGIVKFGGLEPFKTYKFAFDNGVQPLYYDRFFEKAGMDETERSPVYPLFLGMIYKIFGVSPLIAKKIQLFLLVVIAAMLPVIGSHYWRKMGILAGIIAGGFFLQVNKGMAADIMTESVTTFSVFIVLLALIYFEYKNNLLSSILLGIALGAAMLTKGSLYLLPLLTALWILIRFFKERNWKEIKNLSLITVSVILTILPWIYYVSTTAGRFIFISEQSGVLLLDDNNEYSLDGGWHHEWIDNPDSFYYHDGIDMENSLLKIANFYWQNPELFPRIMVNKLWKGYNSLEFMWILIGIMLTAFIITRFDQQKSRLQAGVSSPLPLIRIAVPFQIIFWNFFFITLIFHGQRVSYGSRYVAPMDFVFALLCCVSAAIMGKWIFEKTKLHFSRYAKIANP